MKEHGAVADKLSVKLTRIRSRIDRSERVYRIIKDAVIHRQFTPGVWIKQEQISQAIGISRTTVRPVLARLQSEGLIEARPRRGFRVVEFSQEELDDLFEVREVLDALLAGETALRGVSLPATSSRKGTGPRAPRAVAVPMPAAFGPTDSPHRLAAATAARAGP